MNSTAPPKQRKLRSLERHRDAAARVGAIILGALAELAPPAPVETQSRWMRANVSPLPTKTIRALVDSGEIAAARPGKFLLLDREQHDAWIARHAVDAAANDDDEDEADDGDELLGHLGLEAVPARRSR